MENQDKEEKSRQQFIDKERRATIKDIEKDIHRLENNFGDSYNVSLLKRGLVEVARSLMGLDLFPKDRVVSITNEGWKVTVVPYLHIYNNQKLRQVSLYFADDGKLYEIKREPMSLEDYQKLAGDLKVRPEWSARREVDDKTYKLYADDLFKELRYCLSAFGK